jgi:spermidine/putrescine-binding protein
MRALVRPFEERYGLSVNMEHYGGNLDDIRDQVEAANVEGDVADIAVQ